MPTSNLRTLVALPAFLLAAACSPTVPIDLTREVDVEGDAGVHETVKAIDLSEEDELWDHRDKVDALHLDRVKAEVVAVREANVATTADLLVAFRAEGAPSDGSEDVLVGSVDGASLALGAETVVSGSSAVNGFLKKVLEGSGRFEVHVSSTTDAAIDVRLAVTLEGSVDVKLF